MKTKEIRKLKPEEMEKKLGELKLELTTLEGQSATGTPPKSPGKIKQLKKTIAKMRTIEYERQLEELQKKAEGGQSKDDA